MLQEFDGHLMAKENFIHEQRGKLGEKDKIMFNQKNEMDRLEKKSKMLEYKVKSKSSISLPRLVLPPFASFSPSPVLSCIFISLKPMHSYIPELFTCLLCPPSD